MNLSALTLSLGALLLSPIALSQSLAPGGEVVFVSKQMGVPVEGRFKSFKLDRLQFDPKRPEAAQLSLSIQLKSASLGTPEVEAELAKPEWFDSTKHPDAQFLAQTVRAVGPARFEASGRLSLKGQTRPLTVVFQLQPQGPITLAGGQFTLLRSDWKIGSGDWADASLVAHEVQVRFKFPLSGLAPL
ncbi:YceI family protein [Inhella gelatinilytica]|uniref:YceI family protein n=1 Tax=Inhella gelatinilytica TaxID=2795030 RepID=A0A931NEE3_9BURK|nr:YceI family protein [Inhella gelatinilytica]MBH9553594.1 YceI family protein [Inhella gelatinilytica]